MTAFDPAWIDDAIQLLEGSPVRRAKGQGRSLPEPAALNSMDEIPRRLEALRERVAKPLTLAVLGEVKAGKSTLVNALVGADVAPVDVLEATRWVMEIRHGSAPHALLRFTDGSTREGTPQEIHDLLFARREDAEFVSRCAEVVVSLPQQTLTRLYLIDTPGLATITEEAAARTRHHLTQVDAILWVLNANHLGQMDVVGEMADVARLGKPMVAVINRIDEADTHPARLVRYVRTGLAEYVQEVFAVSARQARQAQQEEDAALLEASGLPQLRAFLEEQIDRQASQVQAQALGQQLLALLQLEQTLHETYAHQLSFLIHEADNHSQRLEIEKQRIDSEARLFVEGELEAYFNGVARELTQRIPQSRGLDSLLKEGLDGLFKGGAPTGLEDDLRHALVGPRFSSWVEQLAPRVQAFMREKWKEAAGQMEIEMRDRFQTFYAGEARRLEALEGLSASADILEGLKQGLTTGGIIGAGLAAYAAALGPSAAVVTMGAALSAFLPPALLVGAGAGVALRLLQSGQQAEKLRIEIRDAVMRHRRLVQSEWVEPVLVPALSEYNTAITQQLAQAFTEKLCHGWSLEELKTLAQEVAGYLARCQEARQRLHHQVGTRAG